MSEFCVFVLSGGRFHSANCFGMCCDLVGWSVSMRFDWLESCQLMQSDQLMQSGCPRMGVFYFFEGFDTKKVRQMYAMCYHLAYICST